MYRCKLGLLVDKRDISVGYKRSIHIRFNYNFVPLDFDSIQELFFLFYISYLFEEKYVS